MNGQSSVRQALSAIKKNITQLSKKFKLAHEPVLIAVSKTKPNEMVKDAYDGGHRDFGENYIQELITKAPDLPQDIRWHFIGNCQSNKAKKLVESVPNLYCVQTVASVKLANVLNKTCKSLGRKEKLKVMVQVNTSGEGQKGGVSPSESASLVKHVLGRCDCLEFIGLMTIGQYTSDPQPECFQVLLESREAVIKDVANDAAFGSKSLPKPFQLSMGMSGDYELAIEMGSSSVRVGSSIFGARSYNK